MKMTIAEIKERCQDGDKATITGDVKSIKDPESFQGKDGTFWTQLLLVADGPKTDDYKNSIWCSFYVDEGSNYNHLKGRKISVEGKVNVYNKKYSLKGCKHLNEQDSPKSEPGKAFEKTTDTDWPRKDLRCCLGGLFHDAAMLSAHDKISKEDMEGWVFDRACWIYQQDPSLFEPKPRSVIENEDVPF